MENKNSQLSIFQIAEVVLTFLKQVASETRFKDIN